MNVEKKKLLSIQNLAVGYRTGTTANTLFENLNLALHTHELVCFMGPNGVGKSTLIRTLAGLQDSLTPTPLGASGFDYAQPDNIAVVLTDKITAVNMTVKELISYGRYPYLDWKLDLKKDDHELIEKAIELTRTQHLIQKKLYELSDGQMQMAMIARALAQDTPILLLDEPTAHLDLNNRVEIMNLLRHLARQEGKAVLVSTHELDLALQTADLIWLAGRAKNIITGIPEDLVLSGVFDEIFQFKGFDLKTGRVEHEAWRGITVGLQGEGPEYLWTKNALERNGFRVQFNSEITIKIIHSKNQLSWDVNKLSSSSLEKLIEKLCWINLR
jgi:iron complex transport system ATP-binding protein